MNAPALTVRSDGTSRTFAPGNDVVVGRDLRADIRIAHPLISRAHVLLRFDQGQGRWVAIDNGSLNGIYFHGRRAPGVDITEGTVLNLGSPEGPALTFEVGRHQGMAGLPATSLDGDDPASPDSAADTAPAAPAAGVSAPVVRTAPSPAVPADPAAGPAGAADRRRPHPDGPTPARSAGTSNLATSMLKVLRPGSVADIPPGALRSAAPPITTSSSPTCWPGATTPR